MIQRPKRRISLRPAKVPDKTKPAKAGFVHCRIARSGSVVMSTFTVHMPVCQFFG
jgi:hypothetical protein